MFLKRAVENDPHARPRYSSISFLEDNVGERLRLPLMSRSALPMSRSSAEVILGAIER